MQSSAIHDWIRSITSIVQSFAVASGIFFALQQYWINSREASERQLNGEKAAAQKTIDAIDAVRDSAEKVITFKSDMKEMDSDEKSVRIFRHS